jgi:hypothetical protein
LFGSFYLFQNIVFYRASLPRYPMYGPASLAPSRTIDHRFVTGKKAARLPEPHFCPNFRQSTPKGPTARIKRD